MSRPLMPLRLLAGLRKYDGQNSLSDWSSTELSQNFKGIELALDNIEKNLFFSKAIRDLTFNNTQRFKIVDTEVEFDVSSTNLVSFGFRGALLRDVSSIVVNLRSVGNAFLHIMRKNLVSGETVELSPISLDNATLRPIHIFYMELLQKGKYSYFMEGRVTSNSNIYFEQIQFFVRVG